jgi:uncharacterized protein (DUF2252 family)
LPKQSDSVANRIWLFHKGRDPELVQRKYQAMRASPFVFLRGTCHLFYERLPSAKLLQNAPLSWLCGDLHLENFGSYKGDNRLVYFDLNDFDEAVLGPCTWDLLRLNTSVLVAAPTLGITRAQARGMCKSLTEAYVGALEDGKSRWIESETAQGVVKELLDGLSARKRTEFLERRTVLRRGRRRIEPDDQRILPVTVDQRVKVERFMARFAKKQLRPEFFRLLDVARRVAGTGSLGLERYLLLIEGKGSPDGNHLLDLKQVRPSALASSLHAKQPDWQTEAHRVVTIQRRMQAIPMAFLSPVAIGRRSYVLRALQPTEDRVALNRMGGDMTRLEDLAITFGQLVAWGQLRSSGHGGSATADSLTSYWRKSDRTQKLLQLADECAEAVHRDWAEFCEATDK